MFKNRNVQEVLIILFYVTVFVYFLPLRLGPNIQGKSWTDRSEEKIKAAFYEAKDRLNQDSCNSLFSEFDTNGKKILKRTLYFRTDIVEEFNSCKPNNGYAYTYVGSPIVKLCNKFFKLSKNPAALVLIHEALHTAGMKEGSNPNEEELTTEEINNLIFDRCF